MRLETLGVIGGGTIALALADVLARELIPPLKRFVCLTKPESCDAVHARLLPLRGRLADGIRVEGDLETFLRHRPDLVIECASHSAVAAYGAAVLSRGIDLMIVSVGALADEALHAELDIAALEGDARLIVSSGALGGVDILAAARLSGISEVTYTSRKPPQAWRGTPAEGLLDLGALTGEAVFFEGTARDAARGYPKNANAAATIALAGAGFEKTRVRLVADPASPGNVHAFSFASACADVEVRIVGKPSPDNPKTSLPTVYALAREVLNRVSGTDRQCSLIANSEIADGDVGIVCNSENIAAVDRQ